VRCHSSDAALKLEKVGSGDPWVAGLLAPSEGIIDVSFAEFEQPQMDPKRFQAILELNLARATNLVIELVEKMETHSGRLHILQMCYIMPTASPGLKIISTITAIVSHSSLITVFDFRSE
jgi:hypothetical protein